MSRKIETFKSIITNPMNTHNFEVSIPGFEEFSIIVQSTSFPSDTLRQTLLYVNGEPIRYATVPQNSGQWPCTIPESDTGLVQRIFTEMRARSWNQLTGGMTPVQWDDVQLLARDLNSNPIFGCKLHGVWLAGRGDIQLSQQSVENNWQWAYAFVYNWLEDMSVL